MALLGQEEAQQPHSKHLSLSIIISFFIEIALTGQTSAHVIHFKHFSDIILTTSSYRTLKVDYIIS